jgi:cell division control protein 6
MQSSLRDMFETYLRRDSIFVNKNALTDEFLPSALLHREREQKALANVLLPALRGDKPSNLFIYGKTGTGKTLGTRFVCSEMEKFAEERKLPLKVVYVNAQLKKVADTEYRLISTLAAHFGITLPATGLPTGKIYKAFHSALDAQNALSLIIIDEIDNVVQKCGNELLYNLMRINSELTTSRVSIIGITNDLNLLKQIDSRVRSSLSEEEIVFSAYDASQLADILQARASVAFRPEALDQSVIPKCAAYAAREHGDARRALNLLRMAGEVAERSGAPKIDATHVDLAFEKLDTETVVEFVKNQPLQSKAVLYAIISLKETHPEFTTGDIYSKYKALCPLFGQKNLTQRRVSDLINELANMGLISSDIVSKGRYGRSKTIDLLINNQTLDKVVTSLRAEVAY